MLFLILIATIIMWTFIIERFWFLSKGLPQEMARVKQEWEARADTDSWYAQAIRSLLISQISV
ncbi:MAG: MotA/TolQ/ExbB proton channel family protein, partial [Pseudomonadota bacterium]